MFIINLTYQKSTDEVDRLLVDHIEYLDQHYESRNFICSGRKEPRTGGIILCTATNLEEVKRLILKDPFHKEGIAKYEIIEFHPTKYVKDLAMLIDEFK